MNNPGNGGKRAEESSSASWGFAKWGKTIASVFKPKKDVAKSTATGGPFINPEALTAQKREWMDIQAAQVQLTLATWPEHLFEHFFVVGLPPDIEVTQIAQDLCELERRPRGDADLDRASAGGGGPAAPGLSGTSSAAAAAASREGGSASLPATGAAAAAGGGGPSCKAPQQLPPPQYDKAPRPAYDAHVLFRHPPTKAAPLSDQELVDLCFPHKVTPVKLRRSPSLSSLHEVVYGRHTAARDGQCFIFLLKVGGSLPLYGICCAVPEVLHRPPHLARHLYPSCRAPFRSVMIAAPRVYCMLSHYPFFDLHFQVLNAILAMERLHRTIDFNAELEGPLLQPPPPQPPHQPLGGRGTAPLTSAGSSGMAAAGAATASGGPAAAAPPHGAQAGCKQPQPTQQHTASSQQQQQCCPMSPAVAYLCKRGYCRDCANAIAEVYPGLGQPGTQPHPHPQSQSLHAPGAAAAPMSPAAPTPQHRAPQQPSALRSLLRRSGAGAAAAGEKPCSSPGPGAARELEESASHATHGSLHRISDPGSPPMAGLMPLPGLGDRGASASAATAPGVGGPRGFNRRFSGGGVGGVSSGGSAAVMSFVPHSPPPSGSFVDLFARISGGGGVERQGCARCKACGRALVAVHEEMEMVPEQGLLEEVTVVLETALDKIATLPKAVAASLQEAAAAAAGALRRDARGGSAPPAVGGGSSSSKGAIATALSPHAADFSLGSSADVGSPQAAAAALLPPLPCAGFGASGGSSTGTPTAQTAEATASSASATSTLASKVRQSIKTALPRAILGGGAAGQQQQQPPRHGAIKDEQRKPAAAAAAATADGGTDLPTNAADPPSEGAHLCSPGAATAAGPGGDVPSTISLVPLSPTGPPWPTSPPMRPMSPPPAGPDGGGGGAVPASAVKPLLAAPLGSGGQLGGCGGAVVPLALDAQVVGGCGGGGQEELRGMSLVQQLMLSMKVPRSPLMGGSAADPMSPPSRRLASAATAAAAANAFAEFGVAAVRSPELPSSPNPAPHSQALAAGGFSPRQAAWAHDGPPSCSSTAAIAGSPAASAAAASGLTPHPTSPPQQPPSAASGRSWAFLQRLAHHHRHQQHHQHQRSRSRSPGREHGAAATTRLTQDPGCHGDGGSGAAAAAVGTVVHRWAASEGGAVVAVSHGGGGGDGRTGGPELRTPFAAAGGIASEAAAQRMMGETDRPPTAGAVLACNGPAVAAAAAAEAAPAPAGDVLHAKACDDCGEGEGEGGGEVAPRADDIGRDGGVTPEGSSAAAAATAARGNTDAAAAAAATANADGEGCGVDGDRSVHVPQQQLLVLQPDSQDEPAAAPPAATCATSSPSTAAAAGAALPPIPEALSSQPSTARTTEGGEGFTPRRALPAFPPSALTSPRLLAEMSACSGQPSDASFYSAAEGDQDEGDPVSPPRTSTSAATAAAAGIIRVGMDEALAVTHHAAAVATWSLSGPSRLGQRTGLAATDGTAEVVATEETKAETAEKEHQFYTANVPAQPMQPAVDHDTCGAAAAAAAGVAGAGGVAAAAHDSVASMMPLGSAAISEADAEADEVARDEPGSPAVETTAGDAAAAAETSATIAASASASSAATVLTAAAAVATMRPSRFGRDNAAAALSGVLVESGSVDGAPTAASPYAAAAVRSRSPSGGGGGGSGPAVTSPHSLHHNHHHHHYHHQQSLHQGGQSVAAAIMSSLHNSCGGALMSPPPPPPPLGVPLAPADLAYHFSPRRALDQLYNHPMINPGEQLTLQLGGLTSLSFTRPLLPRRFTVVGPPRAIQAYAEAELADGLQHWTTAVLCRSLSLDNLLLLLTAALLERQLVVLCPHIGVLSGCVLGLLPLLRPLGWQSLLMPVTPASMIGFLEAPVPFVLGVQYKTAEVVARCSHLVRVNVYKDQVKNAGPPLPQLPGLKRLAAALAPMHAVLRGGQRGEGAGAAAGAAGGAGGGVDGLPDGGRSHRSLSPAEVAAASAFLSTLSQHLASLCGDLRPHVFTNVGLHTRTGVLMKDSLLEVVPPKDKAFVRQFIETQMFSVWSDELISANFEGTPQQVTCGGGGEEEEQAAAGEADVGREQGNGNVVMS